MKNFDLKNYLSNNPLLAREKGVINEVRRIDWDEFVKSLEDNDSETAEFIKNVDKSTDGEVEKVADKIGVASASDWNDYVKDLKDLNDKDDEKDPDGDFGEPVSTPADEPITTPTDEPKVVSNISISRSTPYPIKGLKGEVAFLLKNREDLAEATSFLFREYQKYISSDKMRIEPRKDGFVRIFYTNKIKGEVLKQDADTKLEEAGYKVQAINLGPIYDNPEDIPTSKPKKKGFFGRMKSKKLGKQIDKALDNMEKKVAQKQAAEMNEGIGVSDNFAKYLFGKK